MIHSYKFFLTSFPIILLAHFVICCQSDRSESPESQICNLRGATETSVGSTRDMEEVTIVGFPGLTDTEGPISLIKMLIQLPGFSGVPIMIKRPHENEDIYIHGQNAYATLVAQGMTTKNLLLVGESYGVLVAYAMTLYNTMRSDYNLNPLPGKQLNIKGLISIHGPWQGVSPVAGILNRYEQLQSFGLKSVIDACFQRFNISGYMIPKPLESLDPKRPFLQTVKRTLVKVDYPILALAGSNKGHYGFSPYDCFYTACTSSFKQKPLSFVFGRPTTSIIAEYEEKGHDGLIPIPSTLAEDIPTNDNFKRIKADAPHIHADFSIYPILLQAISRFVQTDIVPKYSPSIGSRSTPKEGIAFSKWLYFKGGKKTESYSMI